MRHILAWTLGAGLLLATATAAAEAVAGGRAYTATFLPAEPDVDGLVDTDPAWGPAADNADGFTALGSTKAAVRATRFRIGCTGKGLYVAMVCAEPEMGRLITDQESLGRVWDDDSVEVFLEPVPGKGFLHLIVNAIGSRFSDGPRAGQGLMDWSAAAFLHETAWSVEMLVPYEAIGAVPEPGRPWRLNVCRTVRTVEPLEHSTWSPCRSQFAEADRFGALAFGGAGLSAADRAAAEARIAARARLAADTSGGERFVVVRPEIGMQLLRPGQADDAILVRLNGPYVAPRLAPEGKRVFYQSRSGGTMGIWSVGTEDRKEERLCDGDQVSVAVDGKRLLLRRGTLIVERDLGSGEERARVTGNGREPPSYPDLLPDGRILYVAGSQRLCLTPREGDSPQALAKGEILTAPAASPDGRWVAYPDGAHLWVVEVATGVRRQLTFGGGVQAWPRWSRDSKSLCYCQTDTPASTVYDLYHVALDKPESVALVTPRIEAAPDWSGTAPKTTRRSQVPAGTCRAFVGKLPMPLTEAFLADTAVAWQTVPDADTALAGECLLDSPWACLVLSVARQRIELYAKHQGRLASVAQLALEDGTGRPLGGPETLSWQQVTPGSAAVVAAFTAADGGSARALFRFQQSRPLVTVDPLANIGALRVLADLSRVVAVDRLADDLLLEARGVPDLEVPLPQSPLYLGLRGRVGEPLLVLIPGLAVRGVTVCRGQQGEHLAGFRVSLLEGAVHVGALAGPVSDPAPEWKQMGPTAWQAKLPGPCLGKWRVASRAGERLYSSGIDVTAAQAGLTLPLGPGDPAPAALSALFLMDRNAQTDLAVLTPLDLVRDALGVELAARHLDERGVRECRGAEVECAFKDYRVPVRIATWIDPTDPGAAASVVHFSEDAQNLLRGLDARADEYHAFFGRVEQTLKEAAAKDPAAKPAGEALLPVVTAALAIPPPATPADVFGTAVDGIRAAATGRGSPMSALVKDMAKMAERVFPERVGHLAACRRQARELCDDAGLLVLRNPGLGRFLEGIRTEAGTILRRRYHAEADWRGETPLNPEEIDDEKLGKLQ